MEFQIWVETRLDGRLLERELVSSVEQPASGIGLEEIGLELEEGKAVLRKVQARIVQTQVDVLSAAHRRCFRCGRNQRVKDLRTRIARTVFGTVQVSCRRYFGCKCRGGKKTAIWPLHRHQLSGSRRSFSTSTLPGAAECRIVGQQRCSANYFLFVIGEYHTLPCVAIHSQ
jgi:hypothetical protein